MGKLVLMVFLLVAGATISLAADFSYNEGAADGPSNWGDDCQKTKQSPIDIVPKDAKHENLGTFDFIDYDKENVDFNVSNVKGITLQYDMPLYKFNVSGGGLPSTYTAVQVHFHWGNNNDEGSEHTMDGKFFPAEVHIVHMNIKYNNLSEALTKQDGLAVLGVFIKIGSENADLESLLEYAENVTLPKAKVTGIPPVALMKFLPANQNEFFRYQGSLTTPPCSEAVVWTVFKDYIEISNAQLNLLRTLQLNATTPIGKNYRPVQPLNGRTVTFSSPGEPTTPDDAATTTSAATTAKGCKLVLSTFGLLLSMLLAGIFLN